jgi:hypothetical protein
MSLFVVVTNNHAFENRIQWILSPLLLLLLLLLLMLY